MLQPQATPLLSASPSAVLLGPDASTTSPLLLFHSPDQSSFQGLGIVPVSQSSPISSDSEVLQPQQHPHQHHQHHQHHHHRHQHHLHHHRRIDQDDAATASRIVTALSPGPNPIAAASLDVLASTDLSLSPSLASSASSSSFLQHPRSTLRYQSSSTSLHQPFPNKGLSKLPQPLVPGNKPNSKKHSSQPRPRENLPPPSLPPPPAKRSRLLEPQDQRPFLQQSQQPPTIWRGALPRSAAMEDADQQHDMAAQQAAAKDYQPEYEGPLVGDKTPIDAVTQEYAKADPVYVEKTITLPQSYSHYRPIRGDGNCGWRAIGFAYYEKLVDLGNQAQAEGEVARLTSFNPVIGLEGGYQYYEDFAEEAIDLVRDVAANLSNPDMARALLHQRWNDPGCGSAIIYYLRLLAATYLKTNVATYAPFFAEETGGIAGYCSQSIELPDREIEHFGVDALANILLKPINCVIEVAYLDRTPGSEVNRYRVPGEANAQDAADFMSFVYLLFRPNHYDILYADAGPSQMPAVSSSMAPISMQVNRVSSFTHNTQISGTHDNLGDFSTVDYSTLAMIPGFGSAATGMSMGDPMASPVDHMLGGGPDVAWMNAGQYTHDAPQHPPHVLAPPQTHDSPASPLASTPGMAVGPGMVSDSPGVSSSQSQTSSVASNPFRISAVQMEYDETKSEKAFHVQTNTFKNSVYNPAHHANPAFRPEQWRPDGEGGETRSIGKKKFRKDS